jgi:hypothetical protein
MKRLRKLLFANFVLISCVVLTKTAFACTAEYANVPFCVRYWQHNVVFMGKAVSEEPTNSEYFNKITFEVLETFKGNVSRTVEVNNQVKEATSCDVLTKIKKDETWVIFLDSFNETSYVSEDSFKYRAEFDKDSIEYLRSARDGKSPTAIYGEIRLNSIFQPKNRISFNGLKVSASRNGREYSTKTNKEGSFNFPLVEPGKYKIRISVPLKIYVLIYPDGKPVQAESKRDKQLKRFVYEYETEVKDKECAFKFILAWKHPII